MLFDETGFEVPSFVTVGKSEGGGRRHVVRGSMWFVAAVSVGAAFSFLFWVVAARVAPQDIVGAGTSLWAQVQFVNYLAGMGLPIALARYGAGRARTVHVLFVWCLIYSAVAALVGTALFAALAPDLIADEFLQSLWQWGEPTGLLIFFALITGMAFAMLVEVRLVTLRQWRWVFGRTLAISVVRMPFLLLPWFGKNPVGLLLLIAGTPALSGFLGVWGIRAVTPPRDRAPLLPLPPEAIPALKYASVNYLGMIAAQAPQFGLPIVVTGYVSVSDFAAFFIAWQITVVIFLIPHTIGQVVLAEGSRGSPHAVNQQVKLGLQLSLGLMVLATVGAVVCAGLVTVVLPKSYELTATLLPRLVAAGIPWAVTCILLAKARVEASHLRTVVITVGYAALTLLPCWVMTAVAGTQGAANAWFIGNAAAAVLAIGITVVHRQRQVPATEAVASHTPPQHAGAA